MHHGSSCAVVEHHLQGARFTETVKTLDKLGWSCNAVPAVETASSLRPGPGHGGVWLMGKKHLHQRALKPAAEEALQGDEFRGVHTQWTARTIRMQHTDCGVRVLVSRPWTGPGGVQLPDGPWSGYVCKVQRASVCDNGRLEPHCRGWRRLDCINFWRAGSWLHSANLQAATGGSTIVWSLRR